ncbi:MAG: hypothetical protein J6Q85_07990 [Clostridia bacterium]|nr:hypothetical protein [Clostridia bacterium]
MKLAIIGDGRLTLDDLEYCVPECVDEILTDIEGGLNIGLKEFSEKHGIKLTPPDKTKIPFYTVMHAIFFTDMYISFLGEGENGERHFRVVDPDKKEFYITISDDDVLPENYEETTEEE